MGLGKSLKKIGQAVSKPIEKAVAKVEEVIKPVVKPVEERMEKILPGSSTLISKPLETTATLGTNTGVDIARKNMGSDFKMADKAITGGLIQHGVNTAAIGTDAFRGDTMQLKQDLKSAAVVGATVGAAVASGGSSLAVQGLAARSAGGITDNLLNGNIEEAMAIAFDNVGLGGEYQQAKDLFGIGQTIFKQGPGPASNRSDVSINNPFYSDTGGSLSTDGTIKSSQVWLVVAAALSALVIYQMKRTKS